MFAQNWPRMHYLFLHISQKKKNKKASWIYSSPRIPNFWSLYSDVVLYSTGETQLSCVQNYTSVGRDNASLLNHHPAQNIMSILKYTYAVKQYPMFEAVRKTSVILVKLMMMWVHDRDYLSLYFAAKALCLWYIHSSVLCMIGIFTLYNCY